MNFALRQCQRREELIRSLLNKKRNVQGIFSLHENFYRPCGKGGSALTRSQKIRIALARVLLSDPRIVILDELLREMDKANADLVFKGIEQVMQGRTTLFISSHNQILSCCEKVYVMGDEGNIKEQGAYEELLNNPDSYFNKLTQFR